MVNQTMHLDAVRRDEFSRRGSHDEQRVGYAVPCLDAGQV